MSLRSHLRTVLCCVVLELGALTGVPMRPDEIREVMQSLAQPKLAQVNPDRPDEGDPPADPRIGHLRVPRGWRIRPVRLLLDLLRRRHVEPTE